MIKTLLLLLLLKELYPWRLNLSPSKLCSAVFIFIHSAAPNQGFDVCQNLRRLFRNALDHVRRHPRGELFNLHLFASKNDQLLIFESGILTAFTVAMPGAPQA